MIVNGLEVDATHMSKQQPLIFNQSMVRLAC